MRGSLVHRETDVSWCGSVSTEQSASMILIDARKIPVSPCAIHQHDLLQTQHCRSRLLSCLIFPSKGHSQGIRIFPLHLCSLGTCHPALSVDVISDYQLLPEGQHTSSGRMIKADCTSQREDYQSHQDGPSLRRYVE